jgi:hypothetical protein
MDKENNLFHSGTQFLILDMEITFGCKDQRGMKEYQNENRQYTEPIEKIKSFGVHHSTFIRLMVTILVF